MGSNPLQIYYIFYELATKYKIKRYKIKGHWVKDVFIVTLKWYHTFRKEVACISICVTKKSLDAPKGTDMFNQYRQLIKRKIKEVDDIMLDIIYKHRAIQ